MSGRVSKKNLLLLGFEKLVFAHTHTFDKCCCHRRLVEEEEEEEEAQPDQPHLPPQWCLLHHQCFLHTQLCLLLLHHCFVHTNTHTKLINFGGSTYLPPLHLLLTPCFLFLTVFHFLHSPSFPRGRFSLFWNYFLCATISFSFQMNSFSPVCWLRHFPLSLPYKNPSFVPQLLPGKVRWSKDFFFVNLSILFL